MFLTLLRDRFMIILSETQTLDWMHLRKSSNGVYKTLNTQNKPPSLSLTSSLKKAASLGCSEYLSNWSRPSCSLRVSVS